MGFLFDHGPDSNVCSASHWDSTSTWVEVRTYCWPPPDTVNIDFESDFNLSFMASSLLFVTAAAGYCPRTGFFVTR